MWRRDCRREDYLPLVSVCVPVCTHTCATYIWCMTLAREVAVEMVRNG